jgi:hypothetical protein
VSSSGANMVSRYLLRSLFEEAREGRRERSRSLVNLCGR